MFDQPPSWADQARTYDMPLTHDVNKAVLTLQAKPFDNLPEPLDVSFSLVGTSTYFDVTAKGELKLKQPLAVSAGERIDLTIRATDSRVLCTTSDSQVQA